MARTPLLKLFLHIYGFVVCASFEYFVILHCYFFCSHLGIHLNSVSWTKKTSVVWFGLNLLTSVLTIVFYTIYINTMNTPLYQASHIKPLLKLVIDYSMSYFYFPTHFLYLVYFYCFGSQLIQRLDDCPLRQIYPLNPKAMYQLVLYCTLPYVSYLCLNLGFYTNYDFQFKSLLIQFFGLLIQLQFCFIWPLIWYLLYGVYLGLHQLQLKANVDTNTLSVEVYQETFDRLIRLAAQSRRVIPYISFPLLYFFFNCTLDYIQNISLTIVAPKHGAVGANDFP